MTKKIRIFKTHPECVKCTKESLMCNLVACDRLSAILEKEEQEVEKEIKKNESTSKTK